jgi:hypothetical protein
VRVTSPGEFGLYPGIEGDLDDAGEPLALIDLEQMCLALTGNVESSSQRAAPLTAEQQQVIESGRLQLSTSRSRKSESVGDIKGLYRCAHGARGALRFILGLTSTMGLPSHGERFEQADGTRKRRAVLAVAPLNRQRRRWSRTR